jgi:poly-gamma-glutamate capsule biosynthesis protein CapA/YwtB (metallophosphatase superfamily)
MKRIHAPRLFLAFLLSVSILGAACSSATPAIAPPGPKANAGLCVADASKPARVYALRVRVTDEQGGGIPGAQILLKGVAKTADASGVIALENQNAPIASFVTAPGFIDEPILLGKKSNGSEISVRLLAQNGKRFVMHSAGDVMLGRRYEEPASGDPLIPAQDIAGGARRVVSPVAALFSNADFRTFNLETVVSDLPDSAKYPGKRFILKSPPRALDGLADLRPSVVGLANNHSRDFLDQGIADTVKALTDRNIPFVGASVTEQTGGAASFTLPQQKLALFAWTTVEGSFVNDSYPPAAEAAPTNLDASRAWQYTDRTWGFMSPTFTAPEASRRIRTAWDLFKGRESTMAPADRNAGWSSASSVYPELQDWVARRGHGGAAFWDDVRSPEAIKQVAAQGDSLIVMQLHAGFQFVEAGSSNVQKIARKAIDAGADIVICHHPHVLQGLEWYKGHLIAYSLGNFVFDQDFLSTFASVFVRTVWEGKTLLEARAVPLEIDAYRPTPAVDEGGDATLYRLWERTVMQASSDRNSAGQTRSFTSKLPADSVAASFRFEHGTARLTSDAPVSKTLSLDLAQGERKAITIDGLSDPRLGQSTFAPTVRIGRDTFGWGRFEDETVDELESGLTHWELAACDKSVVRGDAANGEGFLRMRRTETSAQSILVRPLARVPFYRHRLFSALEGGTALDSDASYSVGVKARMIGKGRGYIKVDLYAFDDANPAEDPTSELIDTIDFALPLTAGDPWKDLLFDIPQDKLGPSSKANMAIFSLRLEPGAASLDVDDLEFIEWRTPSASFDRFGKYDYVRNLGTSAIRLDIPYRPAQP